MESLIRYIKVVGGPAGRETILVGMQGLVSKIFVDNPFPVEIVRLKSMIRCVDISTSKSKLATVDEEGICVIYDIEKNSIINQEPNMTSVAFNSENENLICYSGSGILNVKSHWFTPYQQRLDPAHQGFVVGFAGKCVYLLHNYSMQCLELPLTSQMLQCLDNGMFHEAYDIASLGVTEADWRTLGTAALQNMEFDVAKKSFHRIRDSRTLILINDLEDMRSRGAAVDALRAIIFAHNRRFREAATLLQSVGAEQTALEMFADLGLFDEAQEFQSSISSEKFLLRKKADWAHSSNNMTMAADMLMSSGDYERAIRIMMEKGWIERIVNAAGKIDRSEAELLREIGQFLSNRGEYAAASAIFTKINDTKSIVNMFIHAGKWEEALKLADKNPTLAEDVYLPYARWLAEHDRFDEAQMSYSKAGHDHEALEVLEQLTLNALKETRYGDASCYFRWDLWLDRSLTSRTSVSKPHNYSCNATINRTG